MINLKNSLAKTIGVASGVGVALTAVATHAAADSDLSSGLASTSAIATDNKGAILTFFVTVGIAVMVISIAKAGLNWAIRKVSASVGGGKGHRR